MDKINAKLGTDYQLFNYYGAPDADRVIVAMGSICDVAEEVIDYLNAHGEKVGLVKVRLYRPFAAGQAAGRHSRHRQARSPCWTAPRSPALMGEPLYLDVVTALADAGTYRRTGHRRPLRPGLQGHPAQPASSLCMRS